MHLDPDQICPNYVEPDPDLDPDTPPVKYSPFFALILALWMTTVYADPARRGGALRTLPVRTHQSLPKIK